MNNFNLAELNQRFEQQSAELIISWALNKAAENKKAIVTTNFSPYEAVILHMATQIKPNIEVVWIDSGYALKQTYQFAEKLINSLNLNIKVFTPEISAARQDAVYGGVPLITEASLPDDADSIAHAKFTRHFKLAPFSKALAEIKPDIWLTAVRREQTAFRQSMSIISSLDNNLLKVAPLLNWKIADLENYLAQYQLPNELKYYDPTKVLSNRECGLHTKLN